MRKQLGTYLFVGGGALLIGLVPTLVSIKDGPWLWVLLAVVGLAFATALILQPWKKSPEEIRAQKILDAREVISYQQEIADLNIERRKLLQSPLKNPVPRNGASRFGVGESIVATGARALTNIMNENEIDDMRVKAINNRIAALEKIVDNLTAD